MGSRKLRAGDVIYCHGLVDYIRMAAVLKHIGYRIMRGEGKWTIVIMGVEQHGHKE